MKLPYEATYPITVKQGINDEGHHIMYFLNYSKDPQAIRNIAGDAKELLSGSIIPMSKNISLEPWGVAILEYDI